MKDRLTRLIRWLPPLPALLLIAALFVLVPLFWFVMAKVRNWGFGGSQADLLSAPYFRAEVIFDIVGGYALGILLLVKRSPASVWISLTSIWMAGPPIRFMSVGIVVLSGSLAQRSTPDDWSFLWASAVFPAAATICLLCFRSVRIHYGLTASRPDQGRSISHEEAQP